MSLDFAFACRSVVAPHRRQPTPQQSWRRPLTDRTSSQRPRRLRPPPRSLRTLRPLRPLHMKPSRLPQNTASCCSSARHVLAHRPLDTPWPPATADPFTGCAGMPSADAAHVHRRDDCCFNSQGARMHVKALGRHSRPPWSHPCPSAVWPPPHLRSAQPQRAYRNVSGRPCASPPHSSLPSLFFFFAHKKPHSVASH